MHKVILALKVILAHKFILALNVILALKVIPALRALPGHKAAPAHKATLVLRVTQATHTRGSSSVEVGHLQWAFAITVKSELQYTGPHRAVSKVTEHLAMPVVLIVEEAMEQVLECRPRLEEDMKLSPAPSMEVNLATSMDRYREHSM